VPLILAVDASSEYGSLALARGGELIEEVLLHSPDGFAHVLFGRLERLLEGHALRPGDIDCWAAAHGPGSFTGIRVALSAVKGLAEACGRPVVAVSNLEAVAWFGTMPVRAALLDARRGEVYGAIYDAALRPLGPETVLPLPAWIETVPAEAEILSTDPSQFPLEGRRATTVPRAQARAVAAVAHQRYCAGQAQDPAAIDANYVRRSDAELKWREP
jgi:tRNA threonylcarbamoyladenosine biosynthesis protein TsaB